MTNETNNPIEQEETCGCGHDHSQNHECCKEDDSACGCGHDHSNNHECCKEDDSACGCGHDHDHDHEHTPMVTFENEDGTTEDFPVVDEFELDGETYILVMNEDETVTPLKVSGEDGELIFLSEEEFHSVSEAYAALAEAEEAEEEE